MKAPLLALLLIISISFVGGLYLISRQFKVTPASLGQIALFGPSPTLVPTLTPVPPTPTPTPIPVGTLSGKVVGGYYSRAIANVRVTATGPQMQQTTTDASGSFAFSDLYTGAYQLTIESADYVFPPVPLILKEGENKLGKALSGDLKNPQPLTISGKVYSDKNGNKVKDGIDTPLNAMILIYQNGTLYKNVPVDGAGTFSLSISKMGKYSIDPTGYTDYLKPTGGDFVVDGYGGTKSYNFAYQPTISHVGFKIYVFNDKNENGTQDSDEEYVHFQAVLVTNLTGNSTRSDGNSWRVAVPVDGDMESPVDYATYKLSLAPESEAWSNSFKMTKSETTVTISSSTSGTQVVTLGAHKLY